MDDEIHLLSDGDGLAVIGSPAAVERFLVSEGLPSRDLELDRLHTVLAAGSAALEAGSLIAARTGRWVKLTEKSVRAMEKFDLMPGSEPGLSRAVLTNGGKIKEILEFAEQPLSLLTDPALLSGAAGLMAQLAMRQAMNEITDYLAKIDAKVDDVLRGQKDAVLADLVGVELIIGEAMTTRDTVGHVSDITWSKVQTTPSTIARTQGYALRQLGGFAEKLEQKTDVADLAKAAREAEVDVREWLAVLARCFQLQDAAGVLELDRVLSTSPEQMDRHRLAIRTARQSRLDLIAHSTERLMARMDEAVAKANTKVLLNPISAPALVQSRNHVTMAVVDFHAGLGIDRARRSLRARRWVDAAAEVRDKALGTGAEGVDAALHLGKEGVGRARSAMGKLSGGIAGRAFRQRGADQKE